MALAAWPSWLKRNGDSGNGEYDIYFFENNLFRGSAVRISWNPQGTPSPSLAWGMRIGGPFFMVTPKMPDETFVLLYRKSIDSAVFQNAELWKVWTWCLMMANYKRRSVSVRTGKGETVVDLKPGQFVFGRNEASKALGMKPSSVRNRMQKLKKLGNVDIQHDHNFSV